MVPEQEVISQAMASARELTRLPLPIYARSKASMRGESIATIRNTVTEDIDKILTGGGG